MPTLTYWVATQNDHPCYNARYKTKRECLAHVNDPNYSHVAWGPVKKVSLEYRDGFDLMMQCIADEQMAHWEGQYDD